MAMDELSRVTDDKDMQVKTSSKAECILYVPCRGQEFPGLALLVLGRRMTALVCLSDSSEDETLKDQTYFPHCASMDSSAFLVCRLGNLLD